MLESDGVNCYNEHSINTHLVTTILLNPSIANVFYLRVLWKFGV